MKSFSKHHTLGFSMVEVTLAMGIVAFGVLSTLGLLAVGLNLNQDTVANTEAASVAREVAADLQLVRNWNSPSPGASPRFQIVPVASGTTTPITMYAHRDGRLIDAESLVTEERLNSLYRVDVSFGASSGALPPVVHILVSWPAGAAADGTWPAPGSSMYEAVTSLRQL